MIYIIPKGGYFIVENEQIKAFIAVVEQGTITKAAEHLYTTQSSVSKKINALEEEFRIQLFYRGKGYRKAELTPSGKQFLALCRQWQNIKKEADSLHIQREQIHLSIGAIELINSFTFTEHYRRMLLEHPELCIEIHTHHSGEIYHLVANHYVDLGYVYNQQSHNELIVRPLFQEPMVLICHKDTKLPEIVRPDELNPREEIYLKWSSDYELWHDQLWPGHQFRLHIGSSQMIGSFLDQPDRWVIVPASVVEGMEQRYQFVRRTLTVKMPVRTCYEIESRFPRLGSQIGIHTFQTELRQYLNARTNFTML